MKPMKHLASFALICLFSAGLAGCSDPCETIVDKLNECNDTDLEPNPNCDDDVYDCQADCYDEASCEEVRGEAAVPNSFQDCLTDCGPLGE